LTGNHFVGKLSAMGQPTRPTQPSIPPGPTYIDFMDYGGKDH